MRYLCLGLTMLSLALTAQGDFHQTERAGCSYPGYNPSGLITSDGFLEFMRPSDLAPLKARLPHVNNAAVEAALNSPETIWYDENSMVFGYQDSIEVVTGFRANCVGRKIGEDNASNPGIGKLLNYFGPDYRFLFPFRKAAGTEKVTNVKVINFWVPPRSQGVVKPVKYWRSGNRGRWSWTFPVGTLFGEVLFEQGPGNQWYVFEIRTRTRYLDGWAVDVFRPFGTAVEMANAIAAKVPGWAISLDIRALVNHLLDKTTLVKAQLVSKAYAKVFPAVDGALDKLPETTDEDLIARLLTETTFNSVEGAIWKENNALQTYAPSSNANFSIVPKDYEMGLIPVNEVSCNRCHSETGRRLYDFEFDIQLYGEIWGEDQIFTWHLFEPHEKIYGPWDDADGSRKVNPRLIQSKLLVQSKPAANDPVYKPLPSAYKPESRQTREYLELERWTEEHL